MTARTFAALGVGCALLASSLALAHEVTTFSSVSSGSTVVTATGDGTVRIMDPHGVRHLSCPSGSTVEMRNGEVRIYTGRGHHGTMASTVVVGSGAAHVQSLSTFVCP